MAAYVKALLTGGAFNKTAGTTLAGTFTASSAAGNLIVASVLFDNAAVASKPVVSSISKPGGETANWAFLGAARSTSTTAGAFASAEMWCIKTTVAWTTPTITLTLDTSVTMKAIGFLEYSTTEAVARSTAGTAYSTTTTAASATTTGSTPQAGDLAVGFVFQSNSATQPLGDNDTTAGSWVTPVGGVGTSGGNVATNNIGNQQYKILNAGTHQTYNNQTTLTAGNGVIVAILQQTPPAAPAARTISAAAGTPAQTAVNLTWSDDTAAVPDPTYLIERSPDGSTGWATVDSGQTEQTGYNVTGLTPGTTHYFRVTGSNASGSATSNVAGPITTTTWPKTATLTEPFNNLTAWATVGGTPTISAGQVVLDYLVGSTGEAIQTTANYDFTESSIFFKVTPGSEPATTTRTVALFAYVDTLNSVQLIIRRRPGLNEAGLQVFGGAVGGTTFTYNPATMTYLRMRLAGTIVSVDRSVDGANWTTEVAANDIGATLTANLRSVKVRVSAAQDAVDATDPQTASVDSINVAATTTGQPKVYLSGAFTKKPLKVYSGSAWAEKPVKVWTGSAWKTLT